MLHFTDKYGDCNSCNDSSWHSNIIINKLGMGDKIAGSGLTLSHLKLSILRGGKEGLKSVLTEKVNGKPRVTATSRIIATLFSYLHVGNM